MIDSSSIGCTANELPNIPLNLGFGQGLIVNSHYGKRSVRGMQPLGVRISPNGNVFNTPFFET